MDESTTEEWMRTLLSLVDHVSNAVVGAVMDFLDREL